MLEVQFKTKVLKHLKTLPDSFFIKISDKFIAGIPDIIGCYKGRFVAIELKVGNNKPTKIQFFIMDLIKKAGGIVCWLNEETFLEIDRILDAEMRKNIYFK